MVQRTKGLLSSDGTAQPEPPIKAVGQVARDWVLTDSRLVQPTAVQFLDSLDGYKVPTKQAADPVRVMLLGVPGSGKGTIIKAFDEFSGLKNVVHNTGSIMVDLALSEFSDRVKDRDEIRTNLSPQEQDVLQTKAVEKIGLDCEEPGVVHIIDCHTTTETPEGFMFGLSPENFSSYKPDAIVYLEADASEIQRRRLQDESRRRNTDLEAIKRHDIVNQNLLQMISDKTGVPIFRIQTNTENDIKLAASIVADVVTSIRPLKLNSVSESNSKGEPTHPKLLDPEFIPNIGEKVHLMSGACEKVREVAQSWSQKTGDAVFVMNNMEAGSVFEWGMDHWSSQLPTREDMFEFAEKVTKTDYWRRHKELEGGASVSSEEVDAAGKYVRTYSGQLSKAYRDLAIMSTAQEFIDGGRIDSFVHSTADTRISSDNNEPYYGGQILSRVGSILKHPDFKVVLADTCMRGQVRAFRRYDRYIIPPSRKEKAELHDDDFLKSDDWMENDLIYFDPYFGKSWWDEVPEIIYPTVDVTADTNIGSTDLKDYLRASVQQETGQLDRRKGWEREAENLLTI